MYARSKGAWSLSKADTLDKLPQLTEIDSTSCTFIPVCDFRAFDDFQDFESRYTDSKQK